MSLKLHFSAKCGRQRLDDAKTQTDTLRGARRIGGVEAID